MPCFDPVGKFQADEANVRLLVSKTVLATIFSSGLRLRSAKCQEFLWYDPIQVTIFYLLHGVVENMKREEPFG